MSEHKTYGGILLETLKNLFGALIHLIALITVGILRVIHSVIGKILEASDHKLKH